MANYKTCRTCGAPLHDDDIAIYRKLVYRGAEDFLCIQCLADYFKCPKEEIEKAHPLLPRKRRVHAVPLILSRKLTPPEDFFAFRRFGVFIYKKSISQKGDTTMADTISVSIIITFAAELLFSLALPILALVIWKKKEGTELRPAWIGAAAYFVFGMVLEQLINAAVLGTGSSAVSAFLLGHPWLYAVYGGLSAGILEETARFLVYRTMLKDSVGRENAVTFGIGFGGLECIMVLGLTVLSTLMMSISFNNMGAEAFAAQYANSEYQIVLETIAEINAISPLSGVMNCVERAAVFALQIELSVLMFGAVRSQKFWLYPVSILLHSVVGFLAALYQTNVLTSVYLLEVLLVVYAVAVFFLARKVYGELPMEKPRELDHFGRVIKRK